MTTLPNDVDTRAVLAKWAEQLIATRRPDGASEGDLKEFCSGDDVYKAMRTYFESVTAAWERLHPNKPLRVALPKSTYEIDSPDVSFVDLSEVGGLVDEKPPLEGRVESSVGPDALVRTPSKAEARLQSNASAAATAQPIAVDRRMARLSQRVNAVGQENAEVMEFSLPNAKAGQPYKAKIAGSDGGNEMINITNVIIPEGLGVAFDEASGQIHGEPLLAGEHQISFKWGISTDGWRSGKCVLLVNPDPRSLWKKIDPPEDDPYFKPNTAGETLECNGYRISAGSKRGRSHEHVGSFRDDDYWVRHDCVSGWSVLIVCDGAGSAPSSRMGSKIACETAGDRLMQELMGEAGTRVQAGLEDWGSEGRDGPKTVGLEFHVLFHESAKAAVLAIEEEAKSKQVQARDYATTLLAAAVKRVGAETFVATFWMGDGAIGVYGPEGKIRLMGTPDGGEFAGQTRFLDRAAITDQNFSKRLRVGKYSDVTAIILMTDGVSDPVFETENALSDPLRWDNLWQQIQGSLGAGSPHDKLIEWMDFFSAGHHDDRTIAVLW